MKILRMPMTSPAYSIVVPAYNESERIAASLDHLLRFADEIGWDVEVLVVNDGSGDATADTVRSYVQRDARVHLIENPGNRGKGYSVRNGMLHARGATLIFSDADFSSPIEEVPKLLTALSKGADIAIGSRWMRPDMMTERQPWHRQMFGRMFNLALRVILGLKFKDTQCGLKAFTRRAALEIFPRQQIERWGFDPELLFIARRLDFTVAEVPVAWAHDHRSKINPLRDGIRMFTELLRVRWYALRGVYKYPTRMEEVAEREAARRARPARSG